MGWETQWVPDPTDMSLPVLDKPPEGCVPGMGFGRPTIVRTPDYRHHYYECRHCKGWIEGRPRESGVNTLGPLSGRQGIEYHCNRCGNEIGFSGKMS